MRWEVALLRHRSVIVTLCHGYKNILQCYRYVINLISITCYLQPWKLNCCAVGSHKTRTFLSSYTNKFRIVSQWTYYLQLFNQFKCEVRNAGDRPLFMPFRNTVRFSIMAGIPHFNRKNIPISVSAIIFANTNCNPGRKGPLPSGDAWFWQHRWESHTCTTYSHSLDKLFIT